MQKYRYRLTLSAAKKLRRLPPGIQKRIITKVKFYCQVNPLAYADKLTDTSLGEYRFRIGVWRVVFDKENNSQITIHLIGHRREIYR